MMPKIGNWYLNPNQNTRWKIINIEPVVIEKDKFDLAITLKWNDNSAEVTVDLDTFYKQVVPETEVTKLLYNA